VKLAEEPYAQQQKFCSRECGWKSRSERVAVERQCGRCKETKPIEAFSPNKNGAFGRQSTCKACSNVMAKERWAAKKAARPPKVRPTQEETSAKAREYSAAHYAANKERKQALAREWKRNNPGKMVDYNHRRRARKYAVAYEKIDAVKVAERDNWTCALCCLSVNPALKFPDPGSRSMDHIVPLVKGGAHTYDNIQLAHFLCNNLKFVT
jgi:5-methylcytosine-specific restriction endonuclease McrA